MKINPFALMHEEFDHTGIVFNPDNNKVMTLNKSAVLLWKAFEKGFSLDEAAMQVVEAFEVDFEQARSDAGKFAALLCEKNLLSMD